MPHRKNALKLAAMQARELIHLPAKRSRLVAWACALERTRRAWKKSAKNAFRRALHPRPAKTDVLRVLVHVRGGIGDVCMARVLLKKLREHLPNAHINFCYDSKAIVDAVFQDGAFINGFQNRKYIAQDYDLVMSGCHIFMYDYINLPRIEQLAPDFMPSVKNALEMQQIFAEFEENTPHLDGYLANITVAYGSTRIGNMGLTTGLNLAQDDRAPLTFNPERFALLEKLGLAGKKYVTFHDGINTNTDTSSGRPTRCWPEKNWREFARLFKERFPDVLLVQLGGNKSKTFDFADVSLVGKTAVADLPYILEKALLHVDGESGMVQLANLTNTRSVVIFGPTPAPYFAYARNINLVSQKCTNCMCIINNWMTRCALGFAEEDTCTAAVSAQEAVQAAAQALAEK